MVAYQDSPWLRSRGAGVDRLPNPSLITELAKAENMIFKTKRVILVEEIEEVGDGCGEPSGQKV